MNSPRTRSRRPYWGTLVAIFVLAPAVMFLPGCISCNWGGGGGSGGGSNPTPSGPPEFTSGCCSEGTPSGYFKTNDRWDNMTCGSPTYITNNVCNYQRYDNKAVGQSMNICAGQSLPAGWTRVSTDWSPTTCGSPSSITQNVWRVRRDS